MSDIKSAYKAVALAVWQRLLQQYPDELVEQDGDDLAGLDQVHHADSKGQHLTPSKSVPIQDSSTTNPSD